MNQQYSCHDQCMCNDKKYFIIERAQTSRLVVLSLLSLFSLFSAGYFIGKYQAITMLAAELEQQALADHIHHSMSILYGPHQPSLSDSDDAPSIPAQLETKEASLEPEQSEGSTNSVSAPVLVTQTHSSENIITSDARHYYAQLAGFSLMTSAQKMVNRLQKKGIVTTIVKHVSKHASTGQPLAPKTWYQVVTKSMPKHELDTIMATIKKSEHISNPRIVMVKGI